MSPSKPAGGTPVGGAAETAGGAADRLSRLLAMVPYLLARQGISLSEAAHHFGISTDTLVADLELLFVCGTPGHMPDDLIEAEWDSGRVYLGNADAISRPLRLGLDEALALLVGLRTLAAVPGVGDRGALEGALTKLAEVTGDAAGAARAVSVDLTVDAEGSERALAAARDALAGRRRLRLRYLVASRDEATDRDVDPMRLTALDGRWYLEAWCHRAEDVRLFRLDRVLDARVLDVDGTPPDGAVGRDLDDALFTPGEQDLVVVLDLAPRAAWVAEHYPTEAVEHVGEGLRVRLRTADPGWLQRLVLSLGGEARVVEPRWLADQVAVAARSALEAIAAAEVSTAR